MGIIFPRKDGVIAVTAQHGTVYYNVMALKIILEVNDLRNIPGKSKVYEADHGTKQNSHE